MATSYHIVAASLGMSYGANGQRLTALADVDLAVREGEFLSIIGPSGCGKTTLLRIIGGLLEPTRGRVQVAGGAAREAQARKQIGFVFQDPAVLPWRTVIENVRLPLQVNRGARGHDPRRAEELVALVGLKEFAGYYPHQLSGGMRQRVALARALVFHPALLLMDEPLGALDEITRDAMRYELLRLWEATRKTVVMVTHSIPEAIVLSDRVAVMSGLPGRIRHIVEIDIARPRDESVERSEAFLDYAYRIKRLLAEGGPVAAGVARASVRG